MVRDYIRDLLDSKGAFILASVSISQLSHWENRGFDVGILIGKPLDKDYINELHNTGKVDKGLFKATEKEVDDLAEKVEGLLISRGYRAIAQSEKNILSRGEYIPEKKLTPLPHKKIGVLGGAGWIGKNNLLCTEEYGNGLCICSILTNAPLEVLEVKNIQQKCNECMICMDVCPTNAIYGNTWTEDIGRDGVIDVFKCVTCLKCLVNCPITLRYAEL